MSIINGIDFSNPIVYKEDLKKLALNAANPSLPATGSITNLTVTGDLNLNPTEAYQTRMLYWNPSTKLVTQQLPPSSFTTITVTDKTTTDKLEATNQLTYTNPTYSSQNYMLYWNATSKLITYFDPPSLAATAVNDLYKNIVNMRLSGFNNLITPPDGKYLSYQTPTSIWIHPYNGNEIGLYSTSAGRWYVMALGNYNVGTNGTLSVIGATATNTVYDLYLYNAAAWNATPDPRLIAVAWTSANTVASVKTKQDGILVQTGNPERRYVGIVRTGNTASQTVNYLGGRIYGDSSVADSVGGNNPNISNPTPQATPDQTAIVGSIGYPRMYLSNFYNQLPCRMIYWFGTSWNKPVSIYSPPPSSVYSVAPRLSFVTAGTGVDPFSNNPLPSWIVAKASIYINDQNANAYVAMGLNGTSTLLGGATSGSTEYPDVPLGDSYFSAEGQGANDYVINPWAGYLRPGQQEIYYLYLQLGPAGGGQLNQHPNSGMIVEIPA
jgi:hypothetical protein